MNTPVTSRYSATPTVILEADKPAGEQPMELFITDEYGIALSLFVYQGQKFVEALSELLIKDELSRSDRFAAFESFAGMSAAGFAAVQGLSVTILQAHIEQMDSAAGKLNTMSRLGRWAGIAWDAAFGFGALAAAIDSGKHSLQWGKHWPKAITKAWQPQPCKSPVTAFWWAPTPGAPNTRRRSSARSSRSPPNCVPWPGPKPVRGCRASASKLQGRGAQVGGFWRYCRQRLKIL